MNKQTKYWIISIVIVAVIIIAWLALSNKIPNKDNTKNNGNITENNNKNGNADNVTNKNEEDKI